MSLLQTKVQTDSWIKASWEEFIQTSDDPAFAKSKGYYFDGLMRIEAMGVGPGHALDNGIIYFAVTLFCTLNSIAFAGLINCSYRKPGTQEAQPDISYYLGDRTVLTPQGSTIANLDTVPPPDLAIEIADSSFNDDIGQKRLLYEEMSIAEYWVVDVKNARILAFEILQNGSRRIQQSLVLPGLSIAILETALERSRSTEQSQVAAWLLGEFQAKN